MAAGIPRERLSERVRAALAEGDVVLTAGAGFGKTTLLEQALAGSTAPVAWISGSEADRNPGLLLMRIVRALALAGPEPPTRSPSAWRQRPSRSTPRRSRPS